MTGCRKKKSTNNTLIQNSDRYYQYLIVLQLFDSRYRRGVDICLQMASSIWSIQYGKSFHQWIDSKTYRFQLEIRISMVAWRQNWCISTCKRELRTIVQCYALQRATDGTTTHVPNWNELLYGILRLWNMIFGNWTGGSRIRTRDLHAQNATISSNWPPPVKKRCVHRWLFFAANFRVRELVQFDIVS